MEVKGQGLRVGGTIDLDNPFAAQVYRLLKERRVREFSFGYEVVKERKAKDGANELVELRLIEAGPTLKGANPSTELLAIKSQLEEAAAHDETVADNSFTTNPPGIEISYKAGRSISAKNEARLRSARDILDELLASLGGADEETADDIDEAKVKAEEPKVPDPGLLELQARIMNLKE